MYTVYMHTCPNGKKYIGITGREPELRWHNGHGYDKNKPFWNAIVKYGWDNIRHEILCEGLTQAEACEKEAELIAKHQSNNPAYGYNRSCGGQSGCRGYKWTTEQRKRLSKSQMGRTHSPETRKRISDGKKGEKNPNWGKHPSPETLEKCRISSRAENLTAETRRKLSVSHKRPVVCVELRMEFDSAKDAERELGILATGICKALKGTVKRAGGFHWQYKEE